MLKFSENPPILSPGVTSVSEMTGRWWVAHTKARFEKAFAWDLHHCGIAYFLPMIQQVAFSGGRKRRVLKPLFTGYVFFNGDPKSRYTAMTTGRLCQTLDVPDQAALVAELDALHRVLNENAPLDPYPHAVVGQRCRITAGPFLGIEGTVIERHPKRAQLVLQVGMLGQGAALEIEPELLEPVGESAHRGNMDTA